MKRFNGIFSLSLCALALVLLAPSAARADDQPRDAQHLHNPGDIWTVSRGGRLYDNWMAELLRDQPPANNPAYPEIGRKRGYPTWRCKECHGWDYKGDKGEYRKGSNHYTGIKGIQDMRGKDFREIIKLFMDDRHGYGEKQIPHAAQEALAMFLASGQIDTDQHIDRRTGKAKGSIKRGAPFFQTLCALCHGTHGKEINFASEKHPSYVGDVCKNSPWRALHKIRFGQPGVGMVALVSQDLSTIIDLLSYCQTLPVE